MNNPTRLYLEVVGACLSRCEVGLGLGEVSLESGSRLFRFLQRNALLHVAHAKGRAGVGEEVDVGGEGKEEKEGEEGEEEGKEEKEEEQKKSRRK